MGVECRVPLPTGRPEHHSGLQAGRRKTKIAGVGFFFEESDIANIGKERTLGIEAVLVQDQGKRRDGQSSSQEYQLRCAGFIYETKGIIQASHAMNLCRSSYMQVHAGDLPHRLRGEHSKQGEQGWKEPILAPSSVERRSVFAGFKPCGLTSAHPRTTIQ